jgi:hypothetical protein
MTNTDERQIRIETGGKLFTARYWVRGGTLTISSGLGPDETVDMAVYDKPADVTAREVLEKHIARYGNSSGGK